MRTAPNPPRSFPLEHRANLPLKKRLSPIARVRDWKRWNDERLVRLEQQVADLSVELKRVQETLHAERNSTVASLALRIWAELPAGRWSLTRRNQTLLILVSQGEEPHFGCAFEDVSAIAAQATTGELVQVAWKHYADAGDYHDLGFGPILAGVLTRDPKQAEAIFRPLWSQVTACVNVAAEPDVLSRARIDTELLLERPDLIDFVAVRAKRERPKLSVEPFEVPAILPERVPARPAQRSAVFLHNSYYHFNCLSSALRHRGWDTLTVSLENPASHQQQFYHGEDVNLFDPEPLRCATKVRAFFKSVPERFGALHFYGMGLPSFFPANYELSSEAVQVPFDFYELRRHRTLIGYMPSGCLDGASQSEIRKLSRGVCGRCSWETRPDVCNDARNLAWAERIEQLCDWIGIEGDWATPTRSKSQYVHGPVVTTLDAELWSPNLPVPEAYRIEKSAGEVLVYHAVGNYAERRKAGRDIKGTGAVFGAIEQLQAEGLPVKLFFAHDVPSRDVRFYQVQADIVVDQLNYGRYGANARESIMLGRPVVVRLDPTQSGSLPPSRSILETPMVDASEATVTGVLRRLVLDSSRRADLGLRGRQFAVAWHGSDACAERYERVIDRLRAGLTPDAPELYPTPVAAEPVG